MTRATARRRAPGPLDAEFVLEDYLFYNLNRAAATYSENMDAALRAFGLTTLDWRVLMLLADKSPSTVGELARRSVSKMPTLTRRLIRMERDGLVVRSALSADRRFVEVRMTRKAAKTLTTVRGIGQAVFERAVGDVEPAEIAVATAVLRRVRANLAAASDRI